MTEYAVENLDRAFSDLQSLLPAQWEHTGEPEILQNPNWPLYRQLEANGAAILVMARDEGEPIGYMTAFIYPHPNAVHVLTAEIKTYYIRPGRAIVLNSMAEFMVAELARRGCYKIKAWTHAGHPASRLWELHGFEISDIGLTLRLKKPEGAKYA